MLDENKAKEIILNALPSFDERQIIRESKDFKSWITFWNMGRWNTKVRVGSVMATTYDMTLDNTYEDFLDTYIERCKSWSEIHEQVTEIADKGNLDFETALVRWWIHVIDMRYAGKRNELLVKAECEKKMAEKGLTYVLRESTDIEDRTMGVDLVAEDHTGEVKFGIQIKGERYFKSNRPTVVHAREILHPQNYAKFHKAYGAKVWYAVIEEVLSGNHWQLKPAKHYGIDVEIAK